MLAAVRNRLTQPESRDQQVKKRREGKVNRSGFNEGEQRGLKQGGRKLVTVVTSDGLIFIPSLLTIPKSI
jgi:hypothetical protein